MKDIKELTIIVACEILVPELMSILKPREGIEVITIPAGLHTNMDRLESEIEQTLLSCVSRGVGKLIVFYGGACSPGIDNVLSRYKAVRPEAGNCLDILLGPLKKDAESENAFVLTPGWVRAWPNMMKEMGWDAVDSRINLARYDKAVVFDSGVAALADEEILSFFEITGLVVDVRPLDLSFFKESVFRCLNMQTNVSHML